jgi:NAD(P)-dependent dehydrogenase (short-subunit alcohol dehydrogenase family)
VKNTSETTLAGKIVIVTGASSGLGVELATALAAAGAVPVVAARRADRLAEVTEALPRADAITCDVTREDDRERLVAQVLERHGRIDGLVNNAGMGATAPALKTPATTFSRVVDLNLVAPYALSCLVAEHMRNGGNGGGKSIVNIASVMGLRSLGEVPDAAYVASKAGLIGLTRELASQWGRYGIRVNAVAPGFFASEMTSELGEDAESFPDWLTSQTPLRRGGRPGELDDSILFLLSDRSSFVTGHVLTVDGGLAVR